MPAKLNLSGHRFGRLLVLSEADNKPNGKSQWHCRCDCGQNPLVGTAEMRNGEATSCGCLRRETTGLLHTKHNKSKTPEFRTWAAMINRCTNKGGNDYHYYGGRGIQVCQRWLDSFEMFLADMGEKPTPKHTIERVNNNGNYEPSNCKWATRLEQGQNTRRSRRNREAEALKEDRAA